MPAMRVQVHLNRDTSILQRNVVNQRVIHIIRVIILGL
jgi:hypothetical protein